MSGGENGEMGNLLHIYTSGIHSKAIYSLNVEEERFDLCSDHNSSLGSSFRPNNGHATCKLSNGQPMLLFQLNTPVDLYLAGCLTNGSMVGEFGWRSPSI